MKQLWQDFKRELILAAIGIPLVVAALIWVATDKPADPIRLTLPDPGEVTVCYYIPDLARPYEQEWLGGEKLEAVLAELAATEFTEAEEDPDEETFRAALVVATNEEQITVHVDEEGRAWAFYEGRWLRERR
jgi:hypothetical protein